jgi:iron complex transport system ATP-binding protein
MPGAVALELTGVTVRVQERRTREPRTLLRDVSWTVAAGEHWVVLGPNGAGKTTLLGAISGTVRPQDGAVRVLGHDVGARCMRDPRVHLGILEAAPRTFAQRMSSLDVVLHGIGGSVAGHGRRVPDEERAQAGEMLHRVGCAPLADRGYADLSQGERQRVLIARALMRRPPLLLLDEPTTGLDLPAREGLLGALVRLARELPALATVTVTHHVEELAPSTTHALLLRDGAALAAGPIEEVLTADRISACFGVQVAIDRVGDRWIAHAAPRLGA